MDYQLRLMLHQGAGALKLSDVLNRVLSPNVSADLATAYFNADGFALLRVVPHRHKKGIGGLNPRPPEYTASNILEIK